jgi:hypothetical protein
MPAAVGHVEDETNKPLEVGFAELGRSGMSYGAMQNDITGNRGAANALENILAQENSGVAADDAKRILQVGTREGIARKQFEQEVPGGIAKVNAALARNPGLVADQDEASTFLLRTKVANALGGANTNPNGPGDLGDNPKARFVAKLSGWLNRTGG